MELGVSYSVPIRNNETLTGFISKKKDIQQGQNVDTFEKQSNKKSHEEQNSLSKLRQKTIDLFKQICRKKEEKVEFKDTIEGLRRSKMSDAEILEKAKILLNTAADELGISEEHRPEITTNYMFPSNDVGGGYDRSVHTIYYNPSSFRDGIFEIDNVIMHEATHCKEALLRASIAQNITDDIVKKELSSKILNGENEKIVVRNGISLMGPVMMTPPEMPDNMKQDFFKFARENLYYKSKKLNENLTKFSNHVVMKKAYSFNPNMVGEENFKKAEEKMCIIEKQLSPIIKKIEKILEKYPEFTSRYKTKEEALNVLMDYALSHNERYISFTHNIVGFKNDKKVDVPKLPPEEQEYAEKSLVNMISMIEGNACMGGIILNDTTEEELNQYQFCEEEVLAQKNGNNFLIRNYNKKLEEMRANGTLTLEDEKFLTEQIEKSKLIIKYKEKGQEYYKKYNQMRHNPNDEDLRQEVLILKTELKSLQKQIENNNL